MTPEQVAAKQADLQDLEDARLQLSTGELAVNTSIDGNSVTFQQVNSDRLEQYISRLKAELAPYDSTVAAPVTEITVNNNRMFC